MRIGLLLNLKMKSSLQTTSSLPTSSGAVVCNVMCMFIRYIKICHRTREFSRFDGIAIEGRKKIADVCLRFVVLN